MRAFQDNISLTRESPGASAEAKTKCKQHLWRQQDSGVPPACRGWPSRPWHLSRDCCTTIPTQTGSGSRPAPNMRREHAPFGLQSCFVLLFRTAPQTREADCAQTEGKAASASERGAARCVCSATSGRALQVPGPVGVTGEQGEGKRLSCMAPSAGCLATLPAPWEKE